MKTPFRALQFAFVVGFAVPCMPVTAAPSVGAPEAQVAPDPAGGGNLVANGDFENVKGGKPAGWSFSSAKPGAFATSFVDLPGDARALRLQTDDNSMSGYWTQSIAVVPNTNYRLQAQVRLDSGKALIYVVNQDTGTRLDTRAYVEVATQHPLVPLFWDRAWTSGGLPTFAAPDSQAVRFLADADDWTPVTLAFNSGPHASLSLRLGAYFAAGSYDFKNVSLRQIEAPDVKN